MGHLPMQPKGRGDSRTSLTITNMVLSLPPPRSPPSFRKASLLTHEAPPCVSPRVRGLDQVPVREERHPTGHGGLHHGKAYEAEKQRGGGGGGRSDDMFLLEPPNSPNRLPRVPVID